MSARGGAQISIALQSDKPARRYAELAQQVEEYGFDALSVYADLGYQPPLGALLMAAQRTRAITLGPSCLNPYLTHPMEIAGQIAVLDEASGGRGYLGLTRGAWLDRIHVTQPKPVAALRDTIEIVTRLLRGDTSGYRGSVFTIEPGVGLNYDPLRAQVPILLGVWGPRGAHLAGQVADSVKIGGSANPDMVRLMRSWLDASSEAAGRGAGAVQVTAGAVTVVDDDAEMARGLARREVAMYLDIVGHYDITAGVDPEFLTALRLHLDRGELEAAARQIPDDLLDKFAIAGSPAMIAEQVLGLIDAGAGRVEFGTPHGLTADNGIRLLGEDVFPRIKTELERSS